MEPDSNPSQRRVVQASEILAKIERGEPVEYDDMIVEGDLDLSGLDLPTEHVDRTELEITMFCTSEEAKVIKSSITITSTEIRGNMIFSNAIFREPVGFEGTKFSGVTIFPEARFSKPTTFSGARFSKPTTFRFAKFGGDADFTEAQFSSVLNFFNAQFHGNANFLYAKFSSRADFMWAQFVGDADFVRFKADFFRAKFGGDANFTEAQFIGDANFRDAQFIGDASFSVTKFHSDVDFLKTRFCGYANFDWAQFVGDANFFCTKFIDDANFHDAKFNKELCLINLKFARLYMTWSTIRNVLVCDGPTYLALIKNFKIIEQFSDADDCYYQYRKKSQDQNEWDSGENWRKAFDIIAWISCGYGVRPIHTIFCMLGVVVISWIIFFGYFDSMFESFYFSLMTFTGGKPDNLEPVRWLRSVAMVEVILGYLFMALFVVVLARKLIR